MTRFFQRKYMIYIGMCIALLPVITLRDYTPSNELRYLSIADEAMRNHTFFTFYNHGEIYADKPPLYFWLLMLSKWLIGGYKMWMLALFSLVPAIGILRMMDHWVKEDLDGEHRSLAMLMLFTSGLFLGTSIFLRMDMLMTFFIILALREFWRIYREESRSRYSCWLFPLYLFLAVFTKGPLGLLIPLCASLTFLATQRQFHKMGRIWGRKTWGVMAALCACWFAGIYAEGGKEYLNNLLVHQTVGRAVNSFHHKEAFYYYLLHIWYCAAPWSLMTIGILLVSWKRKFAKSDLIRFFQITVVSTFILLSCISAKLQIYILPAIPFLIYTAVMFLPRLGTSVWLKLSLAIPATIFALTIPSLLIISTPKEISTWGGPWVYAAVVTLGGCGLHALWLLYGKQRNFVIEKAIKHLSLGLLLTVFFGGWAMPKLNHGIGYGQLCLNASKIAESCHTTDFRTWHMSRPKSIDVYLHHSVKVIPEDSLPTREVGHSYVLMTEKSYLPQLPPSCQSVVVGQYAIVTFNQYKKKSIQ